MPNKKKKNKLVTIAPNKRINWMTFLGDIGGCGNIRVIWPSLLINQFKYKGASFYTEHTQFYSNDPARYAQNLFVKFQRSATEQHLKMIQNLKYNIGRKNNTTIFYEADDLLSDELPKTNQAYHYYKENWPYIQQMLREVDGITVSTLPLANYMRKFNNNVVVTPNHLPKFLWEEYKGSQLKDNKKPRILYAGSMNHFPNKRFTDIEYGDFGPTLIEYIKKTTNKYEWVFVGGYPYQLEEEINNKKIEYHGWQHIMEFPTFLKSLNVDMLLAPLEENFFNECKSNIKMLEAAALGVPGVYSNSYPYRKAQLCSKNEEEIISNIEKLATDSDFRTTVVNNDYEKVKDLLFWEENDNILKHINAHFKLMGAKLG